jgi:hypothetical protein
MCFYKGYWGMEGCSGVCIYAHRSIFSAVPKMGKGWRVEAEDIRPHSSSSHSYLYHLSDTVTDANIM